MKSALQSMIMYFVVPRMCGGSHLTMAQREHKQIHLLPHLILVGFCVQSMSVYY